MKSSRRASLRTPFISTFAAGAAAMILSGCGSAVVPTGGCDGGACQDEPPPSDDRPIGCPAAAPTPGTACATDLTCAYGTTTNPCGSFPNQFACNPTNHQWIQQISTCNPPPVMCPATPPAAGASCMPGWGNTCTYHAPACAGEPQQIVATCNPSSRSWTIQNPVCAPATCPPSQPEQNARCESNDVTRNCRYPGRPCGPMTNDVIAQCNPMTSSWNILEATCNPPPPVCPPARPEAGSTCVPSFTPMGCTYPAAPCNGEPRSDIASCTPDGRWVLLVTSCNPPPPPTDAGTDAGSPDDPGTPDAG